LTTRRMTHFQHDLGYTVHFNRERRLPKVVDPPEHVQIALILQGHDDEMLMLTAVVEGLGAISRLVQERLPRKTNGFEWLLKVYWPELATLNSEMQGLPGFPLVGDNIDLHYEKVIDIGGVRIHKIKDVVGYSAPGLGFGYGRTGRWMWQAVLEWLQEVGYKLTASGAPISKSFHVYEYDVPYRGDDLSKRGTMCSHHPSTVLISLSKVVALKG
jgi:hypothetical protein